jgi:hypothetical protein
MPQTPTPTEPWPFQENKNTAVVADAQFLKGGEPCVYVSHDAEDGCWQFLAPDFDGEMERALVVSLASVLAKDPTICELHNMPLGWYATRKSAHENWVRYKR